MFAAGLWAQQVQNPGSQRHVSKLREENDPEIFLAKGLFPAAQLEELRELISLF